METANSAAKIRLDNRLVPTAAPAPPTRANLRTATARWKALGLLAGAALAAACGTANRVCFQSCPPMEGRWRVVFESGSVPADCQAIDAAPVDGELSVTRQGAALTATFGGTELTGTLYESFDFSLNGQSTPNGGGLDAISFRGRYVPSSDGGTAGAQLTGVHDVTLTRTRAVGGNITCRYVRDYTASRP
jgi:hypothetical protein